MPFFFPAALVESFLAIYTNLASCYRMIQARSFSGDVPRYSCWPIRSCRPYKSPRPVLSFRFCGKEREASGGFSYDYLIRTRADVIFLQALTPW